MIKVINFLNENDEKPIYWYPLVCNDIKPGMYEINELGDIKSLTTGTIMKTRDHHSRNGEPYESVALTTNAIKGKSFLKHRLVATTFIPNTDNKPQVNHKDYNRQHNYAGNLEWMTQKENVEYSYDNILKGENHPTSIFTDEQVHKICYMLQQGDSYSNILKSLAFETSPNNMDLIGFIKRGITYKHISVQYNLDSISYISPNYTVQQIELVCEYIQSGFDYKQIAELLGVDISNSVNKNRFYEFIRLIKNRKTFKEISSKYNW